MPFDRSKYPPDWEARSRRIRERDGNRCQFCRVEQGGGLPSGKRCVLTVAHLIDGGPLDCPDDDLAALCQPCHLRLDGPLHARNAAITRRRRRVEAGQIELVQP